MTKIYSTLDDYITHRIAPALADLDEDPTRDQLLAIAHTMTQWHDDYTADFTQINLNRSGYVEREDADFWDVAWDAINAI